jgi:heat shock protein HspQ
MIRGEVKDLRPEYANKFRKLADMIEEAEKQPSACYIHLFWDDQSVSLVENNEAGFNCLFASGALLKTATQLALATHEEAQGSLK